MDGLFAQLVGVQGEMVPALLLPSDEPGREGRGQHGHSSVCVGMGSVSPQAGGRACRGGRSSCRARWGVVRWRHVLLLTGPRTGSMTADPPSVPETYGFDCTDCGHTWKAVFQLM